MGEYYEIVCHTCRQRFSPAGGGKLREIALSRSSAASLGQFATMHPGHHIELRGDEYNYDHNEDATEYELVKSLDCEDIKHANASALARDAELAALRQQVETLTAERDRLSTIHMSESAINGMRLIQALGDFLKLAATSGGPVATDIRCVFEGQEPLPVVHLWATTDGNNPAARCLELRAESDELRAKLSALTTLRKPEDAPEGEDVLWVSNNGQFMIGDKFENDLSDFRGWLPLPEVQP